MKKLRRASSNTRGNPGRDGVWELRKEGFTISLFLLNASENLRKKRTRGEKKTRDVVKKQNFGGLKPDWNVHLPVGR